MASLRFHPAGVLLAASLLCAALLALRGSARAWRCLEGCTAAAILLGFLRTIV
jgi:hypothetical protein